MIPGARLGHIVLLAAVAANVALHAQEPTAPRPAELPDAPVAENLAHSNIFGATPPTRFLGFVGVGRSNKGASKLVYSANYWLTDTYGLYFSRSTVAYSAGVSLSLGHKKDHH